MKSILLCVQLTHKASYNAVLYKNGKLGAGIDIDGNQWRYPDTHWFSNAKLEFFI